MPSKKKTTANCETKQKRKKNKKRKRSDDVTVLKTPEKDIIEDSSFDGLNFDSFSALFTSSMSQYGDVYQSPAPSFSPQQVAYQQPQQQAFMQLMQTVTFYAGKPTIFWHW